MNGKLYVSVEACGDSPSKDRIACIGSVLETEGGDYRSEIFFSSDEEELLTRFSRTVGDYHSENRIEKVTTWNEQEASFLKHRPKYCNGHIEKHFEPSYIIDNSGKEILPAYRIVNEKIERIKSIEDLLQPSGTEYAHPSEKEAKAFFREREFDPCPGKRAERTRMLLEKGMHGKLMEEAGMNAKRLHVYEKMRETQQRNNGLG